MYTNPQDYQKQVARHIEIGLKAHSTLRENEKKYKRSIRRKRRTSRKLKLLRAIQTARRRDQPDAMEAALLVVQTLKDFRGHRIGHDTAMQAISDAIGICAAKATREALLRISELKPDSRRKIATRTTKTKGESRHEA